MANEDLSKLKIDKAPTTIQSRTRKTKLILIVAAAFVVTIVILFVSGLLRPAAKVEVTTVVDVYPSQTFTLLNASGYVVPQRKAAVASKITGRLVSLYVEEGSRVKKGDLIARLESDDLAAQRKQAVANLDVARANLETARAELKDATAAYNREKSLLAREVTTRAAYDAAEARYSKASAALAGADSSVRANGAALQAAEVSLEYALIRAPFDAVVLTKSADIGDLVTPVSGAALPKAAVVTIADMDSLQVEADVSESNIRQIQVGQPCEIQLDAIPAARFRGIIHMIVPTADRSKASVMVKVRFMEKDPRILPEMSAKVAFLSRAVGTDEEKARTAVNPRALVDRDGKKWVFVVREGAVKLSQITTGPQLGDFVEVAGGVKGGEKVVLNPPGSLRDGAHIKVADK
jgi:RND family efflux transporter MFP subunit